MYRVCRCLEAGEPSLGTEAAAKVMSFPKDKETLGGFA